MASSISSLGAGAGILTQSVIDQLKEADSSRIITPFENKIALNTQQKEAQSLISSLTNTFKASASALSFDTIFDTKSISISGNTEVTIDNGANISSFTLKTVALAQKDITKFGAVADKSSTPIASAAGVLKINNFSINYDATTTLQDLAQAITDASNGAIESSILQTGTSAFSLVISSSTTGAAQTLNITDTTDGVNGTGSLSPTLFDPFDATTNPSGFEKIQTATDATFEFNGITVTRATNEVTDLVLGVNIKLNTVGDISKVDITQDSTTITDEVRQFVDSYNALIINIQDSTATKGVFKSNSFVKSISRDLSQTITGFSNGDTLGNYGFSLDRNGTLSFDQTVLDSKLATSFEDTKSFFTGGVDANGNDTSGIFAKIDEKLKTYTGFGKLFSNFSDGLTTESKNLNNSKSRAQASLDTRYDVLARRFIAFDSLINRLNSESSTLLTIINEQNNSNN